MIVMPGTEVPEEFQLLRLNEKAIDCRLIWENGQKVSTTFTSRLDLSGMKKVSSLDHLDQTEKLNLS